jgi:hypothetical protein
MNIQMSSTIDKLLGLSWDAVEHTTLCNTMNGESSKYAIIQLKMGRIDNKEEHKRTDC